MAKRKHVIRGWVCPEAQPSDFFAFNKNGKLKDNPDRTLVIEKSKTDWPKGEKPVKCTVTITIEEEA